MDAGKGWTHIRWIGVFAVAALALTACAKSSTGSSSGGSASSSTAESPSAGAGSSAIGTANVSSVGTVLVDGHGSTLYMLTKEKGDKIVCTGSCSSVWPPVLLPTGASSATAMAGVKAALLGTVKLPDGSIEVTYNGYPLHTYSGDSAPGQANGQGIQGVWFAMTGAGSPASSNSGGGGYGGGGY